MLSEDEIRDEENVGNIEDFDIIYDNICCICLDNEMINGKCITNCNHSFCKVCLEEWLKTNHFTCPICRLEILNFKCENEIIRILKKEINILSRRENILSRRENTRFIYRTIEINYINYLLLRISLLSFLFYFLMRMNEIFYDLNQNIICDINECKTEFDYNDTAPEPGGCDAVCLENGDNCQCPPYKISLGYCGGAPGCYTTDPGQCAHDGDIICGDT